MRGKECQDCGNINYVPELVELVDVRDDKLMVIRLVEICRDCGTMIGENPLDEEQTLSWYNKHRKKRMNLNWSGYELKEGSSNEFTARQQRKIEAWNKISPEYNSVQFCLACKRDGKDKLKIPELKKQELISTCKICKYMKCIGLMANIEDSDKKYSKRIERLLKNSEICKDCIDEVVSTLKAISC